MEKPIVKLLGENGNAFVIIGKVTKALERAGMEKEAKEFMKEATKGDYNRLLQTVMRYVIIE